MDTVDNDKLTEFLNGNNYNVRGGEYDNIYVNGGNNIQNMATEEDHFKVELIEEVFMNKMFEA
jgi:adenine-specific DNA-methyltransferase